MLSVLGLRLPRLVFMYYILRSRSLVEWQFFTCYKDNQFIDGLVQSCLSYYDNVNTKLGMSLKNDILAPTVCSLSIINISSTSIIA